MADLVASCRTWALFLLIAALLPSWAFAADRQRLVRLGKATN